MTIVTIRPLGDEYRLVVKRTGKLLFRSTNRTDCKRFLCNKDEYSYVPTREKGVKYIY